MSREFKLWLLATAACAVLAASVVSTRFNDREICWFGLCGAEELRSLRLRESVTRGNVRRLASAYREAADMALAARVLTSKPVVGEPDLWFAPDVPDVARRSIRAILDAHRASRGRWHGNGRVAVLVVTDTARSLAGRPIVRPNASIDVRAVLPSPETGGRCVTVIRVRGDALHSTIAWNPSRPLLDACAFFDAFGEPGPRIRATLDSAVFSSARLYLPAARDSLRRARNRNALVNYYDGSDVDLYRCAAGQIAVCDSVVLAAAAAQRTRQYFYWGSLPTVARLPVTAEDDVWWTGALMDALAADLGPARFQRLWTSPDPLAESYRSLTGQPIGHLVYDVARGIYGREGSANVPGMRAQRTGAAGVGSDALTIAVIAGLMLAATRTRRPTAA